MRPGRFDRKIRMPKPDTEGRYEILKLHLRGKEVCISYPRPCVISSAPGTQVAPHGLLVQLSLAPHTKRVHKGQ